MCRNKIKDNKTQISIAVKTKADDQEIRAL